MRHLDEYLNKIKKPKCMNVERRETFGREEHVISYGNNCFLVFQTFNTKLIIHITHDILPNERVTYDPGMNHLIFEQYPGGSVVRFPSINKYLSEDYAFQQSLLQEPLFSTEDLESLFKLHDSLDRKYNPHKYHKEPECTFPNSSISFVKTIFSNSK